MTTANGLVALDWAVAHSPDPKYRQAAARAVAWVAGAQPETTQDKVFKVLALTRGGDADQEARRGGAGRHAPVGAAARRRLEGAGGTERVERVRHRPGALCAQARRRGRRVTRVRPRRHVPPETPDPRWRQGRRLVADPEHEERPAVELRRHDVGRDRPRGSYGVSRTGALQVVADFPHDNARKPTRNLEIVLDVSGSMNSALGHSTRWKTALSVLKDVLDQLPDDFSVGLRVYGHRYPARSPQSCSDSELIVPIAKIDRSRILSAASALHPRGETPLVRSVLQTVDDLRGAGAGSVILITDGEESCHGDPKAAATTLEASGIDVRLNIVGFTLAGKVAAAQLARSPDRRGASTTAPGTAHSSPAR